MVGTCLPASSCSDATVDIAIWSTVEQGLAITAGSLATTRPLLRAISQKLGLSTGNRKTNEALGYSSGGFGNTGGGASRSMGAGGLGGAGGSKFHGNKSQVESYVMSSSQRTTRKGGGSWDGLDSDPEDGMVMHHGVSAGTPTTMGGSPWPSKPPGSSHGGRREGSGGSGSSKKNSGGKHGNTTRTLTGNDSQEELQSSGLSSENVVVTRSFLITDERV